MTKANNHLRTDLPSASSRDGFADRRELAANAFERTRMPMVVTDATKPDLPISLANKAFLELTGYSADEIVGRNCRILQGPRTSPIALEKIRAAIADEREVSVEILNYKKSGEPFWNRLLLSPIHDDDGRIQYFFGSQVDMTEYRRIEALEASEHRLLMEVDHRAKNVLAIVESIVRLSDSADAALYAAAVQHRVHALASAHTLLAERGWGGIPIEELIRQQVGPFAADRALINGPQIELPASIVQPLALVIHELAVNAARHGALTGPHGELKIVWNPLQSNRGFEILWRETGLVHAPPSKRGFGAMIVGAMIEKQLKGHFEQKWTHDGVVIHIEVPGIAVIKDSSVAQS